VSRVGISKAKEVQDPTICWQSIEMATVFWDTAGVILLDILSKRSTITGAYYANLLDQLRNALREKRRGKPSKGELIPHLSIQQTWLLATSSFFQICKSIYVDVISAWRKRSGGSWGVVPWKGSWRLHLWAVGTWTLMVQVHGPGGKSYWKRRGRSRPEIV